MVKSDLPNGERKNKILYQALVAAGTKPIQSIVLFFCLMIFNGIS